MATEVLLPKIGFSMNEGVLAEWLVPDGGQAVEGEPLFALESDKSTNEVESPATGTLKVLKQTGETYEVGTVLAVIRVMTSFVKIEKQGPVAVLTMNRPEAMNAIGSHEDCRDLISAIEMLTDDRSISAAVLTGAGRAFSAGGNLRAMKERTGIGPQEQPDSTRFNYRRGVQRITQAFMACEVPLIAAVNGHAIGLGCDLACLCDIRLAAESAKFAASFIKIGLVPGDGGAWSLQKVIGYSRAAEMLLTGDRYTAQEVAAFGLVSKVVPDDQLIAEALAMAARIGANPARALRLTKRLLREAQTQGMSEILELSAAYQALAHETSDHAEALDAFFEKRDPVFTGQ